MLRTALKNWIVSTILFLVGVLNVVPVIVFFSPASSVRMYGVELVSDDISIIVRHRAVLLGLLGAALIFAAFRREFVIPAIVAAVVGKLAFLWLVWSANGDSPELVQVAAFDIGAIVLLLVAAGMKFGSK